MHTRARANATLNFAHHRLSLPTVGRPAICRSAMARTNLLIHLRTLRSFKHDLNCAYNINGLAYLKSIKSSVKSPSLQVFLNRRFWLARAVCSFVSEPPNRSRNRNKWNFDAATKILFLPLPPTTTTSTDNIFFSSERTEASKMAKIVFVFRETFCLKFSTKYWSFDKKKSSLTWRH